MRHIWLLMIAAMASLTLPAQARPRDDALSGAIRCGVVADSRQWLDCYYGAAQPVRAGLGMVPALAAQIGLATSPPAGGAPRDVAVRDEVISAAAACARIAGDRPWLNCYYAAAMPMREQLGLSVPQAAPRPAPQVASVAPAPASPATPQTPPPMPRQTSLFAGIFNKPKPIVTDMPMESYAFDKSGAFTVTLADGQVWEQAAEDEVYHPARWRKEASTIRVTITPDAMHTYIMTVPDDIHIYKVHRIR